MFFPNKSIDLITVSAYKSAQYSTTMFYYKCDFSQLEDFNPNSDTLRMYKPIKPWQTTSNYFKNLMELFRKLQVAH